MQFEHYLKEQLIKHPSMQPQDVIKICYQAAHGAEHLLSNLDDARNYLEKEYEEVIAADDDLYELISDKVCRVNLAAWKAKGLPLNWLFRMFVASCTIDQNGDALFMEYLQDAEKLLSYAGTAFSMEEWTNYLNEYKNIGIPAVHHSEQYRKNENPIYRIIDSRFCRTLPILAKISHFANTEKVCVIAIDGRAASGKTTISNALQTALDADVVQMDDFFLPLALRTEQRLSEPGGNIHYERFAEEVLPFVAKKRAFTYRVFDCSKMDFVGMREIGSKQFCIVEGSYSCHPIFGKYADITVFSDISSDEQIERIRKRNGEKMLEMFISRWIPLEEKYFDFYSIRNNAVIKV